MTYYYYWVCNVCGTSPVDLRCKSRTTTDETPCRCLYKVRKTNWIEDGEPDE